MKFSYESYVSMKFSQCECLKDVCWAPYSHCFLNVPADDFLVFMSGYLQYNRTNHVHYLRWFSLEGLVGHLPRYFNNFLIKRCGLMRQYVLQSHNDLYIRRETHISVFDAVN